MTACICRVVIGTSVLSPGAGYELHVFPPEESDAQLARAVDSFAQATDGALAEGKAALQAQLREVLSYSSRAVSLLVGNALAGLMGTCLVVSLSCGSVFLQCARADLEALAHVVCWASSSLAAAAPVRW